MNMARIRYAAWFNWEQVVLWLHENDRYLAAFERIVLWAFIFGFAASRFF